MIQCTCADGSLWTLALSQAPSALSLIYLLPFSPLPCARRHPLPLTVVDGEDGSVVRVYGSDGCRIGGASTSPSSTRLRCPSTSGPRSRHHLVILCSASPLSAWRSKAPLTSCWARWTHSSSASLASRCRSSLARRCCAVWATPRPWIRLAWCSSPCHHPKSFSKRGHIGTR